MASTYTERFNLEKQDGNDDISVLGINNNMDKIEEALSAKTVTITIDTSKVTLASWGKISARKVADMLFIFAYGLLAVQPITSETVIATVNGVSGVPIVADAARVDTQARPGLAIMANNTVRLTDISVSNQAIYFTLIATLI